MSSTNRFTSLLKDTIVNNSKTKIEKLPNHNNFQSNRFISKHVTEERNIKKNTENLIKSLDNLMDFPELQVKNYKNDNLTNDDNNKPNYIDIIKNKNNLNTNNDDPASDDANVPDGCVCIKYDKFAKQLIWLYGKNTYVNNLIDETDNNELDDSYDRIQNVVNLYHNRKNDYINKWGIEEYDKMFLFQNYDYDYFDKLDEKCN
jgi:hypothetical protein